MEFKIHLVLLATVLLAIIDFGYSMECYVCEKQDDNNGKCLNTIKTCNPEEDMCLSEIKWGTQPYWSQGAKKQYYISKRCATKKECERTKRNFMGTCTHIWYQDWQCAECCAGDRCNYYVITGSSANRASAIVIASVTAIVIFMSFPLRL
uniref:UPAR/Ly6 domain-containing protein n=1 Tax=Cuerna arida TaxID=1464854 RepID=A0A1B6GYW2_9HEMI